MDRDQNAIPCLMMRGGTSRGLYFLAEDLPEDATERDAVLMAAMGSGHELEVDGAGGAQPQTSKVAILSPSTREGVDVEYLFAQVGVTERFVDTKPNCGNILAAVGPCAIEKGLVPAQGAETRVRILNVNTGATVEAVVQTPGGKVVYGGPQEIAGVPGSAAPVKMTFMNSIGGATGALFPTGAVKEEIAGVTVTLIDNAMPMMILAARDVGMSGIETPEEIDGNGPLLERIESVRKEAGRRMGLGDVSERVVPKVGLLSPPRKGGSITSRYLMPWQCHRSHAVTGAVCIATACCVPGTVAAEFMMESPPQRGEIVIEHPSGFVGVEVERGAEGSSVPIERASVLRTARLIFAGEIFVPASH